MDVPPLLRPVLTWGSLTVLAVVATLAVVRLLAPGPPEGAGPAAQRPEQAGQAERPEQAAIVVLRDWDARRSAAYERGDVAALRSLYATGSGAGERDVRLLRSYAARGLEVRGLRQQLLRVTVLDAAPHRLTLRVRDRLAGASVVLGGHERPLPRDRPSTNDVVLVEQDDQWRVWSVDPAGRR